MTNDASNQQLEPWWAEFTYRWNKVYPTVPLYDTESAKFFVRRAIKFILTGSIDGDNPAIWPDCSRVSDDREVATMDDDEVESLVVRLDPDVKEPQWIACPYCELGTRAQVFRGQGVMTGWGECEHYYSASTDAATKPGLVFVCIPQPLTAATDAKQEEQ